MVKKCHCFAGAIIWNIWADHGNVACIGHTSSHAMEEYQRPQTELIDLEPFGERCSIEAIMSRNYGIKWNWIYALTVIKRSYAPQSLKGFKKIQIFDCHFILSVLKCWNVEKSGSTYPNFMVNNY